jgi:hypothetical protein
MFDTMYTEWYVPPRSVTAVLSRVARFVARNRGETVRAAERRHPELRGLRIKTNPMLVFRQRMGRKKHAFVESYYAWASGMVGEWVKKSLDGRSGGANTLMGFVRNIDPSLCEHEKMRGMKVVTDQMIAPMAEEERQAALQTARWPGWQKMTPSAGAKLVREVEERTWKASDHVTCASEYVRKGLLEQGLPAEKVSVLPYPIDAGHYPYVERTGRGVVTVGFVGAVGLRKGAPYFFEVARRLASERIKFVMVGPVQLDAKMAAEKKGAVELVGVVPRSEVKGWLGRFDILLFPSTCEGSAGAVMEAMATGLPVVGSPNSGTVIRSGEDGFLHEYDDVEGLAGSVEKLARDGNFREAMGRAARKRAEFFNLDQYSGELAGLLRGVVGGGRGS